jgi:hypothetical protein
LDYGIYVIGCIKIKYLSKYSAILKFMITMNILFKKTVSILNLLLIICFLMININQGYTYAQNVRNLKIKTEHPYLFVSPDLIHQIKTKTDDLKSFHHYVKNSREKNTNNPEDTALIRTEVDKMTLKGHVDYFINDCSNYGIDAYINKNALSKAYAKQYILSLLDLPITGDDMPIRGKLFALGSLYDWIYDDLDEQLKKRMRNEILDLVEYVDNTWHYVSNAVVDGHSRFGNISVLVALLPIYHDINEENSDRYYKYLQLVIDNWATLFNPFQTWVNGRGSHSMGWAYGASYSRFFPYMVWEFATDEPSWLTDWQRDKVYFNLYGLRNDYNEKERKTGAYDNFPFSADVWASDYSSNLQGLQVLFSAAYYRDGHAKWFYNFMKNRNINGWMFKDNSWDILYNNFSKDEEKLPYDLSLSRYFPHSAFVIMRDSWDFNKNTLMIFKSSSFYAAGHHHKDQNAFTIYYKGPLAIDAGTYEAAGGWGSNHFWNYYTRSVAHNTMLIYDPSEKFREYSNDGGQYFFESDNPALKQIIEGGSNHLDGIIHYEEGVDYSYTVGDATKAYHSSKLKEYKRSIVYLRNHSYNHPVIIVYDKVVSTNSGFKKSYLLHSINEPIVTNNITMFQIDDGMNSENKAFLFQETLLPQSPQIIKIGGRENDQEFYVADDGKGKPRNYNEKAVYNNPSIRQKRELREGGEWRVEISPDNPNKEDVFLNVLSVTDGKEKYTATKTEYVYSEDFDGVIVSDNDKKESTLVLFCKHKKLSNDYIGISKESIFNNVLITGLNAKTTYKIYLVKRGFLLKNNRNGDLISSDQGTLYLDSSYRKLLK